MRAFVECRIKPYYLHHGDLAPGTAHLRTTLAQGQELMRHLRGRVSGLCQPDYVLDIPGGHGKAPVGPDYLSPAHSFRKDSNNNIQNCVIVWSIIVATFTSIHRRRDREITDQAGRARPAKASWRIQNAKTGHIGGVTHRQFRGDGAECRHGIFEIVRQSVPADPRSAHRSSPARQGSGPIREKPERSEQSGQSRGCCPRSQDQEHLSRLLISPCARRAPCRSARRRRTAD